MPSTRCTATTAKGQPCKARAVRNTDPPRCPAHGGAARPPGPPAGGEKAEKQGAHARRADARAPDQAPGTEGQIADLDRRIQRLGEYIDDHADELDARTLGALLELHSKMIGRVTRVRRMRKDLTGDKDTALASAMNHALDRIGKEYNVEL
jgi:hypothetical protein